MSHFSVCVAIPASKLVGVKLTRDSVEEILDGILSPYWEEADDPAYTEFHDCTSEAIDAYDTTMIKAVQYPDGKLVSTSDPQFRKRYKIVDERILDYSIDQGQDPIETEESKALVYIPSIPAKQVYSFEAFCTDYYGYQQDPEGHWGYRSNPNAQWDWFQIGGGFAGRLVVAQGAKDVVPCVENAPVVDGYYCVDGARKSTIAWQKMKELSLAAQRARFDALVSVYQSGDVKKLGPLVTKRDDGIWNWCNDLPYKPGETYEEHRARRGLPEEDELDISPYAFVTPDGEWIGSGEMGWWGISTNDKEASAWKDEVQAFLQLVGDDDLLVFVDCHI